MPINNSSGAIRGLWAMNRDLYAGPGSGPSRNGRSLRAALVGLLAGLFVIPLAHGVWSADAPGRCIRTLHAYRCLKRQEQPGQLGPRSSGLPAFVSIVERAHDPARFEAADGFGLGGIAPGLADPASRPSRPGPIPSDRPGRPPSLFPPLRC